MTVLPTRYTFEPSFLKVHGGRFVDSASFQAYTPTRATSLQDEFTLFLPLRPRA